MQSISERFGAMRGLLHTYATVFRQAWDRRGKVNGSDHVSYELAFLPAHLELIERPVSPGSLWTLRTIVGLVAAVILIAIFCRLDIVASAPGRLSPNNKVKLIQPATTGVVRHIYVRSGQRVQVGQPLLELDPAQSIADADRAKTAKQDALLVISRVRALLVAQKGGTVPKVEDVADVPIGRQLQAQQYAEGEYREYRAKLAALEAELTKRKAELITSQEEISKLRQTAPLVRQQADDYKALVKEKYVASHEYLEKERAAIEEAQELAIQESHARELIAAIDEQDRDVASTIAAFRNEQYGTLEKAEQTASQAQDDETKSFVRLHLTQLVAPVSGVVQELNVHTIGGVVTTAETLMEIVPDDELEVEAMVSNTDIGFVFPGQEAKIKVATFPYTRYGYLTGHVTMVSNDAIQDKKLGAVFMAHIRIASDRFQINDKYINLTAGMEVTAEIRTGTEKVWQYFLGPLLEARNESLRER